jgi:hypothetical protein
MGCTYNSCHLTLKNNSQTTPDDDKNINWFDRQEKDNGFDSISNVPSFKLTPNEHTKSNSILKICTIMNGALMVPGGGRFWALLSPQEHKRYALNFQVEEI